MQIAHRYRRAIDSAVEVIQARRGTKSRQADFQITTHESTANPEIHCSCFCLLKSPASNVHFDLSEK